MFEKTLIKLGKKLASKFPPEEGAEYLRELEEIKEQAKKEAAEEVDKLFE